jgi:hypothetical protein
MGRVTNSRQRQARALGWVEIKEFLKTAGESLRADRERALLCVAYDTMAQRSELVAFNFEDVEELLPNGSGTILIRRSKTDAVGEVHKRTSPTRRLGCSRSGYIVPVSRKARYLGG